MNDYQQTLNKKENIEVWEDLVNIKSLAFSLFICSFTTFTSYFIGQSDKLKSLFFGLLGAIIGFFICSIIITPKRELVEQEKQ